MVNGQIQIVMPGFESRSCGFVSSFTKPLVGFNFYGLTARNFVESSINSKCFTTEKILGLLNLC